MVAYQSKRTLLLERGSLLIDRPICKSIGHVHRDFIALYNLRKLKMGDDVSSFGARHHGTLPRELEMFH
jgi:hypothetical protein